MTMETSIDTLVGSTAPSTDKEHDCGPIIIGSGGAHRRQNSTGSFSTLLSATDPASDPDDSPKMMVHSSDPAVRDAISVIESAGLPYPCCQLLIVFILEALDPRVAALYVIAKGEEEKLHLLAQDWRYIVESGEFCSSAPHSPTRGCLRRRAPPAHDNFVHSFTPWVPTPGHRHYHSGRHHQARRQPLLHHGEARQLQGPADCCAYSARASPLGQRRGMPCHRRMLLFIALCFVNCECSWYWELGPRP